MNNNIEWENSSIINKNYLKKLTSTTGRSRLIKDKPKSSINIISKTETTINIIIKSVVWSHHSFQKSSNSLPMISSESKLPNSYSKSSTIWELLLPDKIFRQPKKYLFLHSVEEDWPFFFVNLSMLKPWNNLWLLFNRVM